MLLQIHNSGQQQCTVKQLIHMGQFCSLQIMQLIYCSFAEALIYIFVLCVGLHCILNKLHCLVVKIDWLCVPPLTTVANMQHDEDAGQR